MIARPAKARRRARSRGFSHVSTTLEAALILGWFAVCVAGEKRLADTVTTRRVATASAEQSVHASVASCTSKSSAAPIGELQPSVHASLGSADRLGLESSALPTVETLGLSSARTFGAQHMPLRDATGSASAGNVAVARKLSCEDVMPTSPKPPVEQLRTKIWEENLRGYVP